MTRQTIKYLCGHEVEKMSKSKYNVQTPDNLIEDFGADTLRLYEMFLGPLEQFKPWDVKGINGVHNFLRKFWRLVHDAENNFSVSDDKPTKANYKTLHKTIKKVEGPTLDFFDGFSDRSESSRLCAASNTSSVKQFCRFVTQSVSCSNGVETDDTVVN